MLNTDSPDKNPNVKNVHERFSRLSVVAAILKNEESRERYDFFFKNGVPKWRGTGYYYSRFRPGLGVSARHVIIENMLLMTSSRCWYSWRSFRLDCNT